MFDLPSLSDIQSVSLGCWENSVLDGNIRSVVLYVENPEGPYIHAQNGNHFQHNSSSDTYVRPFHSQHFRIEYSDMNANISNVGLSRRTLDGPYNLDYIVNMFRHHLNCILSPRHARELQRAARACEVLTPYPPAAVSGETRRLFLHDRPHFRCTPSQTTNCDPAYHSYSPLAHHLPQHRATPPILGASGEAAKGYTPLKCCWFTLITEDVIVYAL